MGRPKINIVGNKYHWWTVISETNKTNRTGSYWLCKCICGNEKIVHNGSLNSGRSKSCGCSRLLDNRREKFFHSRYVKKENGCWEWIGSKEKGYGRYGVSMSAHRYSYQKYKGEIPKGMCVCHNCPNGDNPLCVNPDHLFLGTPEENQYDKIYKNRQSKGEDHGRSKLNRKDVLDIRKRMKNGEFGTTLAKEYKVTNGLIYAIKNYRIWKHI